MAGITDGCAAVMSGEGSDEEGGLSMSDGWDDDDYGDDGGGDFYQSSFERMADVVYMNGQFLNMADGEPVMDTW